MIKLLLLYVLLFCCGSSAGRVRRRSTGGFNYYLRDLLNDQIRHQMTVGDESASLPSLDPLRLSSVVMKWGDETKSFLNGNFTQTEVVGLSGFNVTDLDADFFSQRLTFDLQFPHLLARGLYSVGGKLFRVFSVDGVGEFNIDVVDVVIGGKANFTVENVIQIDDLALDVDFRYLSVDFDNLFGKGKLNDVMNKLMTKYGRFVFMTFKPIIMSNTEKVLKHEINSKLREINIADLIYNVK